MGRPLRYGNDHASTRLRSVPAIAVLHRRIKIDCVIRFQEKFFAADFDRQRSLHDVKKFHSRMLVGLGSFRSDFLKICEEGAQFAFCSPIVEALKKIRNILCARAFGKADALSRSEEHTSE